ncbi:Methyl-accepting chemotaxis protein II [Gemmata obscuriglobus]|uniref:Methyl-accepting chemotaxis protein n=1 Tax=Gemmata obscuriglobus TaxID=114 RepID=A0A2Z3GTP4_9BACT|nr:methyl-accepting chemotaxis protein [Gemmata obscuriglobus]AWM36638.1 methyl-accepting chemotaxis protein [Gemmata obscuriglobus]QEG30725.1 Methyl-accepting chemotaxis protein II [Gemmata obscuriglobus]VTS10055.1 chemotaxis protein : Histidine kinase, HAMP region:chemotaxis sensory transducer OS=Candidatus Methylomirabilis oxyfera GN=DAMO_1725 PE=4 SV=1: 4HB_MCP_1: HAMP: MCPsignal [Gemmata obscuriglobus UQM 2246]
MLGLVMRVNIGPRLIAGFLLVATACFLIGLRGLTANETTNAQLKLANTDTIPSLIHLDNIRSAVLAVQRSERILILALLRNDDKRCQDTYKKFIDGWATIRAGVTEYAALPRSAQDEQLFKQFETALAAWQRDHDKIVGHAKAKENAAAEDAMMKEWASSASRLNGTLTEMITAQQEQAREAQTQSERRAGELRRELWAVMITATVAAVGLGLLLSVSVTRPLRGTVHVLEAVARGDLSSTATVRSGDEVGRLAAALNTAIGALVAAKNAEAERLRVDHERAEAERLRVERENAAERERAEAERQRAERDMAASALLREKVAVIIKTVDALAAGDFTASTPDLGTDDVGRMAHALNQAVLSVRTALEGVREVSEQLADASAQLAAASDEISIGAQEQASSLEETASTLQQITSNVKHSADSAQQARQLAGGSREVAERGGQVVSGAVEAMGEINGSSKKIAEIITTIDEIAFQTNLLALNAAVEAARAGEQGRGFAVVATEVRNLAQRSATAAKEIKGLIQDSVKKVGAGTELVNRSGDTLAEIVTSVKRVTDIVTEMAAAGKEQSVGIEQVNKAISQMDIVTQRNAGQTEELSATAQSLTDQAAQLRDLVARFKLGNNGHPAAVQSQPAGRNSRPRALVAQSRNNARSGHERDSSGRSDGFTDF